MGKDTIKKLVLLFLLLVNPVVILLFWYSNYRVRLDQSSTNGLIELGMLAGLFAVYGILLQVILIGRVKWVEKFFGFDKLTVFHKWNGFLIGIFIIAHPLFLTAGFSKRDYTGFIEQFREFLTWEDVSLAFIGFLIFIYAMFFSISFIKKRIKYETWYYIHFTIYFAIIFSFGHQINAGLDFIMNPFFMYYWIFLYLFVFGNLMIYRFIKPVYYFMRYRFKVERICKETGDVVSVYITGRDIAGFHFEAGQFMILRFLAKGFWFEEHPFSFSSEPTGKNIRVSIKNVGDFTSRIEQLKPGTPVFIDGPHGVFTAKKCTGNKALFIAGGIGITPIRAMIPVFLNQNRNSVLLYSNRFVDGITFKNELDNLATNKNFSVYHVISRDLKWNGEKGSIDEEKILRIVPDFKERDIYLCGPVPMMTTLRNALIKLGLKPNRIHFEKFAF